MAFSNYMQNSPKIKLHYICVFFVGIYMLLLPFEYIFSSEYGTINKYVGMLVIGSCLIGGSLRSTLKSSQIAIILMLLFGIFSGVWAISSDYWNEVFFTYIKNAMLFLAITQCDFSKKQSGFILNMNVIGSLLLVVYLVVSPNVTVDPYSGRTMITTGDNFFDPNYMAADVILPIGFLCGNFYNNLIKKKYIKSILIAFLMIALFYVEILAGSRGALLAILGMLATITLLNLKHRSIRKKIMFLLLIICIVAVVVLSVMPEQILERFSFGSISGDEDGGGGRLVLWRAAWNAIKDNFVIGYGAGCAVPAVGLYHSVDRAAHSLYLSSILEFGIFATLLYFAIYKEVRTAYKKKLYGEVGITIGIMIASVFLDTLSTKFFWTFLIVLFMRNAVIDSSRDKKICENTELGE